MAIDASVPSDHKLAAFTVMDWVGVVGAGFGVLGLLVFPLVASTFSAMYADFGAPSLPVLTTIVTRPWLPLVLALVPSGLLVFGLRPRVSLGHRRLRVVAAFLLSWIFVGVSGVGLYLPVFAIAGAISAE